MGDGQLVGVGQDATDEGETTGVQVSLFDVTDPAAPTRTDTVTVPDSEKLGRVGPPIVPALAGDRADRRPAPALVLARAGHGAADGAGLGGVGVVPDGDALRPAADHAPDELVLHHADVPAVGASDDEVARAFDGAYASAIVRAVVIGDRLLTISERGVIAHDLATLADVGSYGFEPTGLRSVGRTPRTEGPRRGGTPPERGSSWTLVRRGGASRAIVRVSVPGDRGRALGSERTDVRGLRALLALTDLEADLLTIVEGLVALALDRREVNEQVLAAFGWGDEPVALVGVEPLDGALWHVMHPI